MKTAKRYTARIDFTYGGVSFKRGDHVPTSIGMDLERLMGAMYVDVEWPEEAPE